MDLFNDVTQNCSFLCFSLKQKFVSMNWFIVPNLVNLRTFRKIHCKLSEIWELKFANIYKEMYAGGQVWTSWPTFLSYISETLQRIFLKLSRLTKFGTINRFMEMSFCFNEKHKKLQFYVTMWKRSNLHGMLSGGISGVLALYNKRKSV